MNKVIQNKTAAEQIFEIQLELTRISALIDRACLPLELSDDKDPEESMEEMHEDLLIQIKNIEQVIRNLDQLRLALLHDRNERG